jgi:hypothetical protein
MCTHSQVPVDPGPIDAVAGKPETGETIFFVNGERRTVADVARQVVEETTKAQGLPFYVEDSATLLRVAQIMASSERD